MSNFTFLTQEQCFERDKLDVLKKRGTKAALTDFSILLGADVFEDRVENDSSLEGRTGDYWTRSGRETNRQVHVVSSFGDELSDDAFDRKVGARPALPFTSIDSIPTNGESGKRAKDGILEIEYGYYPQKAVPRDMQEILEKAYLRRKNVKNKK